MALRDCGKFMPVESKDLMAIGLLQYKASTGKTLETPAALDALQLEVKGQVALYGQLVSSLKTAAVALRSLDVRRKNAEAKRVAKEKEKEKELAKKGLSMSSVYSHSPVSTYQNTFLSWMNLC